MEVNQLNLFYKLRKHRENFAKNVRHKDFKGVWDTITDKYPESGHFIYEFLQNADDAKATRVDIRITKTFLTFKHNGTLHFNVTDIDDENTVGCINSITAIGHSTKTDEVNKIGKFGLGFKSVFTYTEKPEIYDDDFKFSLTDYIVPNLLYNDYPARKKGETLFYIPFKDGSCYGKILQRLNSLNNPLLFLKNIKSIHWENEAGEQKSYQKHITNITEKDGINCNLTVLNNNDDRKRLYMFSKKIYLYKNGTHEINVGFFLNDNNEINTVIRPEIFCFFPTKDYVHDMCFIMHAPFELTDSRQNLKEDSDINRLLLYELSELASASLLLLRDIGIQNTKTLINSNIFNITQLEKIDSWRDIDNYTLSYRDGEEKLLDNQLFIQSFAKIIKEDRLLLASGEGIHYLNVSDSVYCFPTELSVLLNNKQLNDLLDKYGSCNTEYNFLSKEILSTLTDNSPLTEQLEDFGLIRFDTQKLGEKITSVFMSNQKIEWILNFYQFLADNARRLWNRTKDNKGKELIFRLAPIIQTAEGKWIAPYNEDDSLNVYLPVDNANNKGKYNFVAKELLQRDTTQRFFRELGIKEPDRLDYIQKVVLQKYNSEYTPIILNNVIAEDFETVYSYYKSINNVQQKEFITYLCGHYSLCCNGGLYKLNNVNNILYLPSNEIEQYLGKKDKIINTKIYQQSIINHGKENILDFFRQLGVCDYPKIIVKKNINISAIYDNQIYNRRDDIKSFRSKNYYSYDNVKIEKDYELDGFPNFTKQRITKETSLWLWEYLDSIIEKYSQLTYAWKYRNWFYEQFDSTLLYLLKTTYWIVDNDQRKHRLQDTNLNTEFLLDLGYKYSKKLFDLLNIKSQNKEQESENNLTDEQIEYINIGKRYAKWAKKGYDLEGYEKYCIEQERKKQQQERKLSEQEKQEAVFSKRESLEEQTIGEYFGKESESDSITKKDIPQVTAQTYDVTEDISPQLKEFIQKEEMKNDLNKKIQQRPKYTKEWFESLLELEYFNTSDGDGNNINKSVSITFSKIIKLSDRIYQLKNPSRYIPQWIDELDSIEAELFFTNQESVSVLFEISDIRDYTLSLKLKPKDVDNFSKIDLNTITKATINHNNPIDLLGNWKKAFKSLNLEDNFDLKNNINNNLKFIFGPPGTGKTTFLSNKIVNIFKQIKKYKILVLAPTNKACDVLTKKIVEISQNDCFWLKRFVTTGDKDLEDYVCERDYNFESEDKFCLVSTITRLSFDYFTLNGETKYLSSVDWDLIIVDEASMIPLFQMMYLVYKYKTTNIYIAGDPFQIEPILKQTEWQQENIYTMINLNSFDNPKTEPLSFEITNLTTQYRSVPVIGDLFSQYSYNGKLQNYRTMAQQRKIYLGDINLKTINYIPFKVEQYDSMFGVKKLSSSPLHIYSALLVGEFMQFITRQYSLNNPDELLHIGIICPYRSQAQFIEKLAEQCTLPENVSVEVGTIHSFQGDECDVIIAVLNPPLGTNSKNIFLNKKNIINVAVSRAKDYLFLFIPHKNYKYFGNLTEIIRFGRLSLAYSDDINVITCDKLEEIMFGKRFYIENNTFVTSHNLANVYTAPERKYEIRIDDNAVDIQIKRTEED